MVTTLPSLYSSMSLLLISLYLSLFLAKTWALDMSIISYDQKNNLVEPGLRSHDEVLSLYESWIVKHGKSYNSLLEKEKRFEIFKDNLRYIDEHNSLPNRTFKLGLNRFADLTNEEYRKMYLGGRLDGKRLLNGTRSNRYEPKVGDDLPDSIDWRDLGAVVPIKEQGDCGSSWAFSAIAAVEGINQIVTGSLILLSEQQLLDCDTSISKGCKGGVITGAFEYIIDSAGIDSEEHYPYTGSEGKCDNKWESVASIDDYEAVPILNEMALKKAVANQPVSVAIDAKGDEIRFYTEGIFFTENCGTIVTQGVAIVGYAWQ